MNFTAATNLMGKARELLDAGNLIEAARLFLDAQKGALQRRSVKREDLAFSAHSNAVATANRILGSSKDEAERAEAAIIKTESTYKFRYRANQY